jgi:ribokinase
VRILNYGSLNVDYVYRVDHIVRPGETISGQSLKVFAGGKGANQSTALARAGAAVIHAGKVGRDGQWLKEKLAALGVDTRFTRISDQPTGHAIIQVDAAGENAIFLFPGTNRQQARDDIDEAFAAMESDCMLLLQNEINELPYIIEKAHQKKMRICLNPAPFGPEVLDYPLEKVHVVIFNETEGRGLSGEERPERMLTAMAEKMPKADLILTLGKDGAVFRSQRQEARAPAVRASVVDTTAAGDTFIGYYLAAHVRGEAPPRCLEVACKAAALRVSRPGAADSIPTRDEVDGWHPE